MMCFVTMGEWSNKEVAKNQGVRQAIVQVVHSRQPAPCLQNNREKFRCLWDGTLTKSKLFALFIHP